MTKLTASERRIKERGDRTPHNLLQEIETLRNRKGGKGSVAPQIEALREELSDLIGDDT